MIVFGYKCQCCDLKYEKPMNKHLCSVCKYHQASEIEQSLKRHREHEEQLRVRHDAASEYADRMKKERDEYGEKMYFAYRSRDKTIDILRKISDIHELRADGSCKCGLRSKCKVAIVLADRTVEHLLNRLDEFEDKQRRNQKLMVEMSTISDPYKREEFIQRVRNEAHRQDNETA